jgi:hypothetical protein
LKGNDAAANRHNRSERQSAFRSRRALVTSCPTVKKASTRSGWKAMTSAQPRGVPPGARQAKAVNLDAALGFELIRQFVWGVPESVALPPNGDTETAWPWRRLDGSS